MSDLLTQIEDIIDSEPDSAPSQDKLEAVTDLLSGTPEEATAVEPVGDDETNEEAPDEIPAEVPDGIDYSAEVPMQDGSKVTLGALKDAYQDSQRNVLELQERENALMVKYNEVNELSQYTQLPPERLEAIKQQQQQYLQQQHEQMLAVMPELNDQAVFTKTKEGIMNLASEYGVQEIVAGVSDHRVVKLLNDFVKLRNSIKTAKDNVKPLRSKEPKAINKSVGKVDAATNAAQRAAQTGNRRDQQAAVEALLK